MNPDERSEEGSGTTEAKRVWVLIRVGSADHRSEARCHEFIMPFASPWNIRRLSGELTSECLVYQGKRGHTHHLHTHRFYLHTRMRMPAVPPRLHGKGSGCAYTDREAMCHPAYAQHFRLFQCPLRDCFDPSTSLVHGAVNGRPGGRCFRCKQGIVP